MGGAGLGGSGSSGPLAGRRASNNMRQSNKQVCCSEEGRKWKQKDELAVWCWHRPPAPPPTRLPRRRRQAAPPDPPPPGLFPQPSSCTQLDPSSRPKFKLQASLFSAAYRTGPLYWRRGRRQVLNRALPGLAAGVRLFFHFGGPLGGSPGRRYPGPHHFGARAPVNLYIGGRGGF